MQPTDDVRPPGHGDPTPLREYCRMMIFGFGKQADPVREIQRAYVGGEAEFPLEPLDVFENYRVPIGHHCQ